MSDYRKLLASAIEAAMIAGSEVMEVYHGHYVVEWKDDRSPLTLADKLSHEKISTYLKPTGLPILSEEGKKIPYGERRSWKKYWLVDPIDGTKEFIKRNGEFTVNIALVEEGKPVLGVVFAPDAGLLYFGSGETGSYLLRNASDVIPHPGTGTMNLQEVIKASAPLPLYQPVRRFTVIASRSHASSETEQFISDLRDKHGELHFISKGSSLKLCLVAEGSADVYPRLAPTMEWDTAAGHAVAVNAGCSVEQFPSGLPLEYNKENLVNPFFVISRK